MKTKPYLPFHMGYLTDSIVTKAEKELGETEAVKPEAIIQLRKMLKGEKKLTCPTDDAYLLQYLRARKFNVKKAFQLMQNYHQVKKSYSDIYDTFDSEILNKARASKAAYCLPYRDEDGCVVLVMKLNRWDPGEFSLAEALTYLTVVLLYCIEDPATEVCGTRVLVDVQGASLRQMRAITPRFLHLLSRALRNCLPIRFKGIHIYNESQIFQYIWSLLKLLLTEKIKNRVHFHGDNQKQLQKYIPKAILPTEDYGGDNPSDVAAWFNTEIINYYEKYAELTTYGYRS